MGGHGDWMKMEPTETDESATQTDLLFDELREELGL